MIEAYERGDLSPEEELYLKSVVNAIWPSALHIIQTTWFKLEPILTQLGLWPIESKHDRDIQAYVQCSRLWDHSPHNYGPNNAYYCIGNGPFIEELK